MSIDESRFQEWCDLWSARVREKCVEYADDVDVAVPLSFQEDAFTAVALETLEDLGQVGGAEVSYFDAKMGRSTGKLNAWAVDEDNDQIDIYTTIFAGAESPTRVPASELTRAVDRAIRVYAEARTGYHEQMEPASAAFDMMSRFHQVRHSITRLRVIVLVDGTVGDTGGVDGSTGDVEVQIDIWDLQRIFRADSSSLPYEPIEIDILTRLGSPLPCIAASQNGADYRTYLAIIPGELLFDLYHEFGPRLLELNVRSFLQARGKVNRGIRDTLTEAPQRFLAYNNGLSATAEELATSRDVSGNLGITRIKGLQIVNGGQTVASIHRAKHRDKRDLSDVQIQAKITIIEPEHIDSLVPLISRYANTQNRVSEADFSANHPFHVKVQQLSQTIWTPGEQNRWFYERARGQYEVAKAREGTTRARRKHFEAIQPSSQRFDKVKLAKYENAWAQLPHTVSLGGQKNFVAFMQRVAKLQGPDWEPDADYFRHLVAKAIIFKRAEKAARQHKFPAYRANAASYTVAVVSYRTAGRINLDEIWNRQDVSQALAETIYEWMPEVYTEIVDTALGRNVTEWCKKEECWRHIQTIDMEVGSALEAELAEGQPLPTVGDKAGQSGLGLSPEDRENIARVMQVSGEEWLHICGWGAKSGELKAWQVGIASTLAGYAAAGWSKVPSKKQAAHGLEMLSIADESGGRLRVES